MKKLIYILLLIIIFTSCGPDETPFPKYTLDVLNYIPDSLQTEYRTYIMELTRAAHNNLSAGEYEEADHIVYSSRNVAQDLFEVRELGLRKSYKFSSQNTEFIYIPYCKMTDRERIIFRALKRKK